MTETIEGLGIDEQTFARFGEMVFTDAEEKAKLAWGGLHSGPLASPTVPYQYPVSIINVENFTQAFERLIIDLKRTLRRLSALRHRVEDFAGIHRGALALFKMFTRMYVIDEYEEIQEEPIMLICVIFFLLSSVVFLLNLLVAQFTCAYTSICSDMVGLARLNCIEIIVETMPGVTTRRWQHFVTSLQLEKRLEFNEGDVGLAGGIQVLESSSANPTAQDNIRRFGGSTSPEMQWPEEDKEGDDETIDSTASKPSFRSIDEEQKYELRAAVYSRFFALAPTGQDYFKQSNTYLHVIADKALSMTVDVLREPVRLVDEISGCGLRLQARWHLPLTRA